MEFAFFSAFFFLSILNKKFKRLILSIAVLNLCVEIFLLSFHASIFEFWAALTGAVFILSYSIFFFYEQVNSNQTLLIYQSFKFWIAVGCILYLSGTLFVFLYTSDIKDRQDHPLWLVNILFEIVKNVFFAIAFIVARNNKKLVIEDAYDTNMFEKPF